MKQPLRRRRTTGSMTYKPRLVMEYGRMLYRYGEQYFDLAKSPGGDPARTEPYGSTWSATATLSPMYWALGFLTRVLPNFSLQANDD
ncbi:hypothetical protein LTR66_003081 [Elasticomyces elasticus]|nr:hypothetical protein LTR50_003503 [Elasticomyces elasticus]KAK4997530.1 hypothetical protein LTR66_003081 [Elasticomyces elasticus]